MLLAAVGVVPAAAAPAPRSIFQDDLRLLRSGDAVRVATLDELRALGVDAVRVLLVWRDVAPAPRSARTPREPEALALGALDALVRDAAARGLDVLLTPTGPGPLWASGCRAGTVEERQLCRPSPAAFARFVAALGRRYPGVRSWAVWNEPNQPRWLTPQFVRRGRGGGLAPASPDHYRRLVRAAAAGLARSGHAGDELLAGETAPLGQATGTPATRPMMPGRFLRALLCRACARLPVTGISHHAYTRGGALPPRFPAVRDELTVSALGALTRLVDAAAARGRVPRGLPIHLTEGGWQTDPPDRLFGVPLAAQAAHLNEAEWMARAHPRVRSVAQYLLVDEINERSFQSGLRFADGRPKPSLAAYRLPVWAVRRGATVTVWGRARGARAGGGDPPVLVQRRLGGGAWRTLRSVPAAEDLLVRVPSARGRWRLRWGATTSRVTTEARR